MSALTSSALTLALVLAGGAARAQPEDLSLQDHAQTRYSQRHETGVVMAVDAAAGMLKIKDSDGRVRRFSAGKAKVQAAEGKTISLADIAVGDQVSVSYDASLAGRDAIEVLRMRRIMKR